MFYDLPKMKVATCTFNKKTGKATLVMLVKPEVLKCPKKKLFL